MKRRLALALPTLLTPAALAHTRAHTARCTHPGLGRGFHLGEVFGRTAQDFADMAAVGATLLRFGIALLPDAQGQRYEMPTAAMPELRRQLELARSHGLRLVLVLRPPPEPESTLWTSPALQASLIDHWRRLAQQLVGRTEVAAFDLVNEAHPPGLTFGFKQARWDALATKLIDTVRAVDPTRTLVLEPSPGARPMAFRTATKLPYDNLVYSVHMYEPFEFTHQRVGDPRFTDVVDYPGPVPGQGVWNRERLLAELAPVQQFGQRHGVPIFVGEFGVPRWAPGAARERYLGDLLALFHAWQWSWTYHAWREWHGWDAEMRSGDPLPTPRRANEPTLVLLRAALLDCGAPVVSR